MPLRPRARKIALVAHVVTSVGWLGTAAAMLALGLRGLVTAEPAVRLATYETMHFFDLALNAPFSLAMLATGLISALGSPWGLRRHRWVLVKLTVSGALMIALPFLSAPRLITLIATIPAGVEPPGLALQVVLSGATTVAVLGAVTTVSVFKPWGRTRWWARGRGHAPGRPVAGRPA